MVKGYAATFGCARVSRARSEDLPALGSPTRPTSARSFRCSSTAPSSPGTPALGEPGRLADGRLEARVAPPAAAAARDRDLLARADEVEARPVPARHLRAGRHGHDERVAVAAVALGALAVPAPLGAEVDAAPEALEVAQVVVAAQEDVAAAAAVAAVRAALGHVRLAPEREGAVAARAGAHLDPGAVVEHRRLR